MKDFYRTSAGRRFFEQDVPALVEALNRIATQLERKNKLDEKKFLLEERIQRLTIKEAKKNA